MMKHFWLFCGLLFFLISCEKNDISNFQDPILTTNLSTGQIDSIINLGGTLNDVLSSTVATLDNGYIAAGHTQSDDLDITDKNNTSFDFWVIKFDKNDTIEWNKTYGGSGDDRARKIIQTSDGNFVIIGYTDSADGDVNSNNGFRDFWIVKLNQQGDILWQKTYGFAGNDEGFDIKESSDGSFYATGLIDVSASGGQGEFGRFQSKHAGGDYWLLKLSSSGDLIWSRFFGGTFTDTAFGLEINSHNEIVVVGSSDSIDTDITSNKGSYDIWTIKVGANGDLIWEKSFGGSEIDQGKAILKSTLGYYITGDSRSADQDIVSSKGGADIWFSHIDETGEILNSFNLGGSGFDVPRSIINSVDGNLIITGSSRSADGDLSTNKGQNDVWIVKFDANGSIIWETSVGGDNIDLGYQSAKLNDGSIVVVGETSSSNGDLQGNKGFSDGLIIKIK